MTQQSHTHSHVAPTVARRYPAVVDDVTVRLIASVVLVIGLIALGTQQWWLYAFLAADFIPRAIWGPSRSFLATGVLTWVRPRVHAAPRPTAGAPKRFAAAIGAVMTTLATALWFAHLTLGVPALFVALVVVAVIMAIFPALEAFFGFCVGCKLFGLLARLGLVRDDVCVDCV